MIEGNIVDVCEDVVGDDEGGGEEELDYVFKDVVYDKVCLYNDEV